MSSGNDRQSSATNRLQIPGLVQELSPVEQKAFPRVPTTPFLEQRTGYLEPDSSPDIADTVTDPLLAVSPDPAAAPGVTRALIIPSSPGTTRVLTGTLPPSTTTSLRAPVVIRGNGKKSKHGIHPPKGGRRWVISISAFCVLMLITVGTAFAVAPLGHEASNNFNPFQALVNLVRSNNNNPNLVAQQATATAIVHQDGYQPNSGGNLNPGGVPTPIAGSSSGDAFPIGQCTFWADYRYHQLSGYFVPWSGNANAWAYGASMYGWVVSSKPHVPSIIVLQAYVQGASYLGHVAVVERINANGSVVTSNMNWYGNGGFDIVSDWTFNPGPGVSFVWHP